MITFLGYLIAIFHRLYGLLFWKKYIYLSNEYDGTSQVILSTWHQHILLDLMIRRPREIIGLASKSKDGELVTGIAKINQWITVRGSSSKGGKEALDGMEQALKENPDYTLMVTVDGPRGPAHKAKRGVFEVARRTGVPVVPYLALNKKFHSFRSWDRFRLPYPFTKAYFVFGEPMYISKDNNSDDFLEERKELEKRLMRIQHDFSC